MVSVSLDRAIGDRNERNGIIDARGLPQAIRSDNGPEFTSRIFWPGARGGKSSRCISSRASRCRMRLWRSFHGKLRDECLNASGFQNLFDERRKIAAWRKEYNEERPHSSLD